MSPIVCKVGELTPNISPIVCKVGEPTPNMSPIVCKVGEPTPNMSPIVCKVGELTPNISPIVCKVGELTPNISPIVCKVGELTPNWFSGCSIPATSDGFYTKFLHNCGRCESHGTATCPNTVVGVSKGMLPVNCGWGKQGHATCKGMLPVNCGWGKQRHATCEILSLQQSFFLCPSYFMEIILLS